MYKKTVIPTDSIEILSGFHKYLFTYVVLPSQKAVELAARLMPNHLDDSD